MRTETAATRRSAESRKGACRLSLVTLSLALTAGLRRIVGRMQVVCQIAKWESVVGRALVSVAVDLSRRVLSVLTSHRCRAEGRGRWRPDVEEESTLARLKKRRCQDHWSVLGDDWYFPV